MNKKHLLIASINLILSFSMLSMVIFAWFSLSDRSHVNTFEIQITEGVSYSYQLTYYTKDAVYRYEPLNNKVTRYNPLTLTWETSNLWPTGYHNFTSYGVFINQYDPILQVNNTFNNLIVELKIEFENTGDITLMNTMIADSSIATQAVNQYGYTTSKAYYASEVTYIQRMVTNVYATAPEGTNHYTSLTSTFSNTTLYPRLSFYGLTNNYNRVLSLNQISVGSPNQTIYVYYNFSYFESKITSLLAAENISISTNNINNIPYILFYQDIKIQIREVTT